MASLLPGAILLVGALLLPLLRGRVRQVAIVALPLLSGAHLVYLFGVGSVVPLSWHVFGYELMPVRVDKLSLVFGLIFSVAALLHAIYTLHAKDAVQPVAGLAYAGSAIGAVFAGDLATLFVYWELTSVTSVFLIWARRTDRSTGAGMRYLFVQVGSGVLLLAGILFHVQAGNSLAFGHLGTGTLGTNLILTAFGVKAAFPLLHNWLTDGYPEATAAGSVWLSAFTTKMAIYALARGFAGFEALVWVGAVMAIFPLFYAAVCDDLRRVLAYGLVNALGFMVVGIGVGTDFAINGVAAHAVSHVLYKSLLFMALGAVLHRTGTAKASELGGLFRTMPWTTVFCCIGAFAMSGPLFCGFTSKAILLGAAAEAHHAVVWHVLVAASAGVFLFAGIRVVSEAFFGEPGPRSGEAKGEAPGVMLVAMGATAGLCLLVGVYPQAVYRLLPSAMDYQPYTVGHVVTQLQLLGWTGLAFVLLRRLGWWPAARPSVVLDADWTYRRLAPALIRGFVRAGTSVRDAIYARVRALGRTLLTGLRREVGPGGDFAKTWPVGDSVLWVALLLGAFLILYYL